MYKTPPIYDEAKLWKKCNIFKVNLIPSKKCPFLISSSTSVNLFHEIGFVSWIGSVLLYVFYVPLSNSSKVKRLYLIRYGLIFSFISEIILSINPYNFMWLLNINNAIFVNNVIWIVFIIFINGSLQKYFC